MSPDIPKPHSKSGQDNQKKMSNWWSGIWSQWYQRNSHHLNQTEIQSSSHLLERKDIKN